jgi:UrcA family protein
MKTIAPLTTIAVALFAASLAPVPASAQIVGARQISVSPAGLDLATAKGRAALDLRLLHAARTACGIPSPADLRGRSKADQCVAEAIAAAASRRDAAIALGQRHSQSGLASSR